MASVSDFRRVARDVSNWGRWGADDELGTLNFITAEKVAQAAGLVRHGKVFPLGVDFGSSGPQGAFAFRHNPVHVMTVDGGDVNTLAEYGAGWVRNPLAQQLSGYMTADNPFRFNDDMIIMPLQAASQWDALSHVYYDDKLYNGFPADSVTSMGAYHCGIDKVDGKGITSRGVLLDLVRHRGAEVFLESGNPIAPEELDDAVRAQGVTIGRGDIVLIRTGWAEHQGRADNVSFDGEPGLDVGAALWLAEREIAALGADNFAVEVIPFAQGTVFPVHQRLIRDFGVPLLEGLLLHELAATGCCEFMFVAGPLPVVGGTGSPINPIAIL